MMKSVQLSKAFVRRGLKQYSEWDLGNAALYDLCRKHPDHRSVDAIVAKVWLIGRSYAASIERGRDAQSTSGDDFYIDVVAPQIRRSGIDDWFAALRSLERPDAGAVVPVHARLTDLFARISGLEKRSLASKYLHFHFPRAAYIFDERASRAIRLVTSAQRLRVIPFRAFDDVYARFVLRCEVFHAELERLMGRRLSPREVDTVLLAVAARG